MKKYLSITLLALFTLVVSSCTKKADVEGIEPKLPNLRLSSLGYQQTGPFTTGTTLALNFGATATNTPVGAFKIEVFSGTTIGATAVPVKVVNFANWNTRDDSSLPATATSPGTIVHAISFVTQPTSYPNTVVYGGTILLKLSALGLTSGTTYSVRATAYGATATIFSSFNQTSFFKIQ